MFFSAVTESRTAWCLDSDYDLVLLLETTGKPYLYTSFKLS